MTKIEEFCERVKSKKYREELIKALLPNSSSYNKSLEELFNYTLDKIEMFNDEEFETIYDVKYSTIELVLPSVKRIFGKIFIDIPPIFNNDTDNRKTLLGLYFNIDEFLIYLKESFIENKEALKNMKHLDRTAETFTLLVDDYLSGLMKKVSEVYDIDGEIKILKRDNKLNYLL